MAEPGSGAARATATREEIEVLVARVGHWHHVIQFPGGVRSPGTYDPTPLLQRLRLPADLAGARVLDVGTRDGFFAFACEARGASVVAIDHAAPDFTGFETAKKILRSNVEYVQANVYDLAPERFGQFDIVLFLGVIYHLRHPLLALDRLRELTRPGGTMLIESLVCDERFFVARDVAKPLRKVAPALREFPIAQFLPAYRFHGDGSNKWSPNLACLSALVEDARFAIERSEAWKDRALIRARAIEDAERTRLFEMDRGFRNVP